MGSLLRLALLAVVAVLATLVYNGQGASVEVAAPAAGNAAAVAAENQAAPLEAQNELQGNVQLKAKRNTGYFGTTPPPPPPPGKWKPNYWPTHGAPSSGP